MTQSDEAELTSQKAGRGVIRGDPSPGRQLLLLTVAVLIVGIVAILAIILAAVSLGRPSAPVTTNVQVPSGGSNTGSSSVDDPNKIWVFAIGHDGTNLEYIDDLSGTVRGFHVDIIEAVCSAGNKNCRLMWDVYENCYSQQPNKRPRPGVGLVSRWYDACTGWFATYERTASVAFTKPFRKPLKAVFFVKRGNPLNFDSTNLTGKKIAFLDGHASNIFCVQRAGITGVNQIAQIVHYQTREEVVESVNNEQVDAVFANDQIFNLDTDLDVASGTPISTCMQDGAGMMVRKDSRLPDWWNPAFDQLKQTSQYRDICTSILENHDQSAHEVDCVY
ncbi:uncharacterized protein LOC110984729 [Acanthaster planci]|uniref:Uncharacterized protein LOC110984729 n=1 Tax=Acanthaster planci TaxID=133434 RepID=A0A8B7Z7D7_ACAPL|nr:uncharacterized protein LOC110984729 [Acanthaster planci]XP_022100886.1 uncharacterized protein LOC110984729 [Acanthaster planci]